MKKTSKTVRAAILLLVLCMISTAMLGGTFAKYTSEYSGQDTALVARWSFTGELGDTTDLTTEELRLFDHLYANHINRTDGLEDPNFIIAPGVGDEFTVKMDYIADVDADVVIEIETLEDSANVPMEYSVDGGITWVTLANLSDKLATKIVADSALFVGVNESITYKGDKTFSITAVTAGSTTPINIVETVKWRWPYEAKSDVVEGSTNKTDTDLGEESQLAVENGNIDDRTTYGIKITITATQVTPVSVPTNAILSIAEIIGTTVVGEVLTAGALDPNDATATYQWQRSSDNLTYTNISGATGSTYTLDAADENNYIKVVATGSNGYSGTVTSTETAQITATD